MKVAVEEIELGQDLGKGEFGIVSAGVLRRSGMEPINVAVKRLTSSDLQAQELFIFEAHLQTMLMDHKNILKLLGVQVDKRPVMIVTELMVGGDLLKHLRDHRSDNTISVTNMSMAILQLADAMQYLQRNRVVHRDLAARNVLIGADITDVRLADFGMSRQMLDKDYYKKTSDDKIPVKWMSPEAIQFKVYTHASDAWSFGILMWEIFSLGTAPWAAYSNLEAVVAVANGQRLSSPDLCPPVIFQLMSTCWQQNPEDRPSFYKIFQEMCMHCGITENKSFRHVSTSNMRHSLDFAARGTDAKRGSKATMERSLSIASQGNSSSFDAESRYSSSTVGPATASRRMSTMSNKKASIVELNASMRHDYVDLITEEAEGGTIITIADAPSAEAQDLAGEEVEERESEEVAVAVPVAVAVAGAGAGQTQDAGHAVVLEMHEVNPVVTLSGPHTQFSEV
jgi:serine/threonine protein kinase